MTSLDLNDGAPAPRPQSLSPSSLLRRAVFGLLVLFFGTFASVWLYDATIKANASTPAVMPQTTGEPTRRSTLSADPITALRTRAAGTQ